MTIPSYSDNWFDIPEPPDHDLSTAEWCEQNNISPPDPDLYLEESDMLDRATHMILSSSVRITDDTGRLTMAAGRAEPEPASVVLLQGEHGTAWQRYFSDGQWHRVGGSARRTWLQLLNESRLTLVYDAPARKPEQSGSVCCCEASPPEFGGLLPDRDCPIHGAES